MAHSSKVKKTTKRKHDDQVQRNVKLRPQHSAETSVSSTSTRYMTVINRVSSDPALAQAMLKTTSAAVGEELDIVTQQRDEAIMKVGERDNS